MSLQVIWQSPATKQLDVVVSEGIRLFGERIAAAFYWRVRDYSAYLSDNPFMGIIEPLLAERRIEYRSLVIHKHYKLIYRVENDKVYIADLWDTRCEPARLTRRMRGK